MVPKIRLHIMYVPAGTSDFTEACRFGKETMLSRMFQVMKRFQLNDSIVAEDEGVSDTVDTQRMNAYSFTTESGKNARRQVLGLL